MIFALIGSPAPRGAGPFAAPHQFLGASTVLNVALSKPIVLPAMLLSCAAIVGKIPSSSPASSS